MQRLTFTFLVALLTFVIGVVTATFWIIYRLPSVEKLDEPMVERSAHTRMRVHIPGGWRKVDVQGKFSFLIPPDMNSEPVQPEDSYVEVYRSASMRVSFDYGRYSDPLIFYADKPDYKKLFTEMAGKKVKFVTFVYPEAKYEFKYIAAVHFADVGVLEKENYGKTKLTMRVSYNNPDELETAKLIFGTIEFP